MKNSENTQGGKRKGAGRKPTGESAKVSVSFRLANDVVKTIRNQPNQAEFVENAIRASRYQK